MRAIILIMIIFGAPLVVISLPLMAFGIGWGWVLFFIGASLLVTSVYSKTSREEKIEEKLLEDGEKKSIYFCKHCKYAASTEADLYNHSVKEHKDESEVLRQRLVKGFGFYECTSCRFEALTVSEIKKHCDDKGHADYIFKSKNS